MITTSSETLNRLVLLKEHPDYNTCYMDIVQDFDRDAPLDSQLNKMQHNMVRIAIWEAAQCFRSLYEAYPDLAEITPQWSIGGQIEDRFAFNECTVCDINGQDGGINITSEPPDFIANSTDQGEVSNVVARLLGDVLPSIALDKIEHLRMAFDQDVTVDGLDEIEARHCKGIKERFNALALQQQTVQLQRQSAARRI